MWHDSCIRDAAYVTVCYGAFICDMAHVTVYYVTVWHDSFIRDMAPVTVWHDSCIRHVAYGTVRHDSFIRDMSHVTVCYVTAWHDSCIRDMAHVTVWHDSVWHGWYDICNYMWHNSYDIWNICDMTRLTYVTWLVWHRQCMWRDSNDIWNIQCDMTRYEMYHGSNFIVIYAIICDITRPSYEIYVTWLV